MAELATGAVSTLLGVINNEVQRLGRVRGDVKFIQEEMESMSSFLENLANTSRQHDEQVRTWMNQVRILANDCNTCIYLYLYRGDPKFHRHREGLRYYLCWAPWLLRKMIAQHRAAGQLSELKVRARDIAERRMRYDVEVKRESSSSLRVRARHTELLLLPDTQDDYEEEEEKEEGVEEEEEEEEEEDDRHHDQDKVPTTTMKMDKDDYLKWKLQCWIGSVEPAVGSKVPLPSIAFLVPKTDDASVVARQALSMVMDHIKTLEIQKHVQAGKHARSLNMVGYHLKTILVKRKVVFVNIPEVHLDPHPLQPEDILYYILHELKQQQDPTPPTPGPSAKWAIYQSKEHMIYEISRGNFENKATRKIEEIKKEICGVGPRERLHKLYMDAEKLKQTPLPVLLWELITKSTIVASASADHDQENKDIHTFAASYGNIIQETAKKLKRIIQEEIAGGSEQQAPEYEDILQQVFPRPTTTTAATRSSTSNTSIEGQIQEIIEGLKQTLHKLLELDTSSGTNKETSQAEEPYFGETINKRMDEICRKIEKQVLIKSIMLKIQEYLQDDKSSILVILRTDDKYVSIWEETRNILSLLGCTTIAGATIVATKTTQQDKQDFGYPQELELIEYPHIGRFLDTVLKCTGQHIHEDIRNILHECEPYEFCMKIFAQALCAKPKRSSRELRKLHTSLQSTQKSLAGIASKMLQFSYMDLSKEYRSCLLYLAIFPQGSTIRRSTLIGRWVAEGLITTKDLRWFSSVDEAEKCFDTLIARCLVCPAGTGATGRVKSCTVDKLVYGFIAKTAMKRRILETRLSRHLARHFSIFSDICLHRYEQIDDFLQNIPKLSQFSKITVLDLEGCDCFPRCQKYMKVICTKILMLKYLSLKGTGATNLPSAINNLFELEVLDIRQTEIPASETRHVMLRKIKRLLAGHVCSSPSNSAEFSSVKIPEKIKKMEDVEVLSNVEPHNLRDLNDIGKLFMLKKLGVVINKDSHLLLLLEAIGDLLYRGLKYPGIRSLSITINIGSIPPERCQPKLTPRYYNVLESLSIIGSTQKGKLLKLLATDADQLAKVTLSGTPLSQEDLKVIAKLPKLRSVRLRHIEYTCTNLIFTRGEFQSLHYFLMEESNIIKIMFEDGSASKLEKIVWSFSNGNKGALSGIDNLSRIKELQSNRDIVGKEEEEAINIQGRRLVKTEQDEMQDMTLWKVKE